jgi:hypothetical protein
VRGEDYSSLSEWFAVRRVFLLLIVIVIIVITRRLFVQHLEPFFL